jgi:hypothetical protein
MFEVENCAGLICFLQNLGIIFISKTSPFAAGIISFYIASANSIFQVFLSPVCCIPVLTTLNGVCLGSTHKAVAERRKEKCF